uniref:Family with sequence similarity 174 member B n=1 Tax=Neogobius melanostomus TaxID=47308 RepID=A0A8C6U463_9GOBI
MCDVFTHVPLLLGIAYSADSKGWLQILFSFSSSVLRARDPLSSEELKARENQRLQQGGETRSTTKDIITRGSAQDGHSVDASVSWDTLAVLGCNSCCRLTRIYSAAITLHSHLANMLSTYSALILALAWCVGAELSHGSPSTTAAAAAAAAAAPHSNSTASVLQPPGHNATDAAVGSRMSTLMTYLPTLKKGVVAVCVLTAALVVCLVIKVVRSGRRIRKTRKYDIITTPAERVEMAPLNQEQDDDDDSTLFDVKYR